MALVADQTFALLLLSHHIPDEITTAAFTIHYDTLRAIRASIRETQEGFLAAMKARPAPFPHPDSWLTYNDTTDANWMLVQDGHDIVQGTIVHYGGLLGMPTAPAANTTNGDINDALGKFNGEFALAAAAAAAAPGP